MTHKPTPAQLRALKQLALRYGRGSAYSIGATMGTMNALHRAQMITRVPGQSGWSFTPHVHDWRITPEGIAALKEAGE